MVPEQKDSIRAGKVPEQKDSIRAGQMRRGRRTSGARAAGSARAKRRKGLGDGIASAAPSRAATAREDGVACRISCAQVSAALRCGCGWAPTAQIHRRCRTRAMATALRCGAGASGVIESAGYGRALAPRASAWAAVQLSSSGRSVAGADLLVRARRARGRRAAAFSVTASVAETASSEVEMSGEQIELLEKRKAFLREEERASGFVVTEVDTTGHQDWHAAKVVAVREVAAGVRCLTLETEVSRELVALESAYMKPGNVAQIRLNGKELKAVPSSPPFSAKSNVPVLYKLRGDIPAGTVKMPQFSLSVKAPVELHVDQVTNPELYALTDGQELEVGPHVQESGLDLRPVLTLARFPTVVFLARGRGVAVARAIIEATDGDNGSMNLSFRDEVRLFCSASKPSELAYQDKFAEWESKNVKVRTTVDDAGGEEWQGSVGSFTALWDEDDLEYDPFTTAAIVCVENETRPEVMELLAEAGIPKVQIVSWEC